MGVIVILAPAISPYDPMRTSTDEQLEPPSYHHLLGTDLLGRDVLSRLLFGGRRTISIACLATGIALFGGTCIGILAGILGSRWDNLISLIMSAVLAFPGFLLGLVVLTLLGPGILPLALAVGVAQVGVTARVVRASVIEVRSLPYIESATLLGANSWHTAVHHIFPNIFPILVAYTGVVFGYSVINGAGLSFLGLGGEPGVPDWGVMLAEGRVVFRSAPWVGLAPGIAITLTILIVNHFAVSRNLSAP